MKARGRVPYSFLPLPFCPHSTRPEVTITAPWKNWTSRSPIPSPICPSPNIREFPNPQTIVIPLAAKQTPRASSSQQIKTRREGNNSHSWCPTRTSGRSLPTPRLLGSYQGLADSNSCGPLRNLSVLLLGIFSGALKCLCPTKILIGHEIPIQAQVIRWGQWMLCHLPVFLPPGGHSQPQL